MKLYTFRTVPLSIIRSFSLYTQQWYMSYRFAGSLRAGSRRFVLILLASCHSTPWIDSTAGTPNPWQPQFIHGAILPFDNPWSHTVLLEALLLIYCKLIIFIMLINKIVFCYKMQREHIDSIIF